MEDNAYKNILTFYGMPEGWDWVKNIKSTPALLQQIDMLAHYT